MVRALFALALVALFTLACAPSVDVEAEVATIRANSETWQALDQQQDAAGVAALFGPDGAIYWENQPPAKGTAALEAAFARSYATSAGGEAGFSADEILMSASGDLAVEMGNFDNGEAVGRYATIHQKVDGAWRVHSDFSVNTDPSGGAPEWARTALRAFYEAYNAEDAAGLAAQFTEDGRVGDLENGAKGRAAIQRYFEAEFAENDVTCNGEHSEFMQVGSAAVGWGVDVCERVGEGGETITSYVNWLSQYEQQADGSWLTARDIGETIGGDA